MNFWILQTLNGITFGMVLFLLAAGLSLIYGLMRIVNLAHGCFYLVGAYVALSVIRTTNSFVISLISGVITVSILGIIMQRFFLRRFQNDHLSQILLTIGFVLIFGDLVLLIWGGEPRLLPKPLLFRGSVSVETMIFPAYHLVIIATGVLVAIGLWFLQEKTKMGALIRAGVDDAEMTRGLGINVPLLFSLVFILGAALGAFGGVIAGPFIGVSPGMEWEILLLAMAVLLIGGQGSLKGAFIGSLLVSLVDNYCKALIPELGMFFIFGSVAIVLAFKPTGLFGKL
jgi:branched-chain amino acid transport system permease protein